MRSCWTQRVLERAGEGHESRCPRPGARSAHCAPAISFRKRVFHGADPGQAQLRRRLQGPEHALRSPSLRRIGRDQLAELVPTWVGLSLSTPPPASGYANNASPGRYRRAEQPRRRDHLADARNVLMGPPRQRRSPNRPRMFVQGHESHHCPQPTLTGAVLVQHLPAIGRRGRLRRCAPRRGAGRTRPCACKVRRSRSDARRPLLVCLAVKSR